MNERKTVNEQADNQRLAQVASGLSKIEKPKKGLGAEFCIECDEPIPMARRKAYNCEKCIECKEREEY